MAVPSPVDSLEVVLEVWFDIEWFDSNVGIRVAKHHLTRAEADEWLKKWKGEYQCRLVEVTQIRRAVTDVVITDHVFKEKLHAVYAISTYGSELAGDILTCEKCGRFETEHKYSRMYSEEYRRHREGEDNVSKQNHREL
jgi:hypothetical protein